MADHITAKSIITQRTRISHFSIQNLRSTRGISLFILTGLVLAFLSACGSSATEEIDYNAIFTAIAITQTAQATPVTGTPTVAPSATPTIQASPTVTATALAVNQYDYIVQATATSVSVCDGSTYVSDVTIPDGTVMLPNQTFTKTWLLSNTGTCTWSEDYALTFTSGEDMDGDTTTIDDEIAPGEQLKISISMTAPNDEGTYIGYWKMMNDDGATFGTAIYVQIEVSDSASTLTPTPTATGYTSTPTSTSVATSTSVPTATSTFTPVPPTNTPTPAVVDATLTPAS